MTDFDGHDRNEDSRLRAALFDVPIPIGLADRLKAATRAQSRQLADTTPSLHDSTTPSLPIRSAEWMRRAALVAVIAASIFGFAFLARSWTAPTEPSWLTAQCESVLMKIESETGGGQPASQPTPAVLATVLNQLFPMKVVGERPMAELSAKLKGRVYHLQAGDGRKFVLLRLAALPSVRGVSARFSSLPTRSGGWSMAAMTVGNETIVLAAKCTNKQLMGYLRLRETT